MPVRIPGDAQEPSAPGNRRGCLTERMIILRRLFCRCRTSSRSEGLGEEQRVGGEEIRGRPSKRGEGIETEKASKTYI